MPESSGWGWGSGMSPLGVGYLVKDTFTDDDAVALESHTPDIDSEGNGWSVLQGTAANFKISSNKLLIDLNSGTHSIAVIDAGSADVTITVEITVSGNNPFFAVRCSDASNFWACACSNSGNALRLQKVEDGGWSTIDSDAMAYQSGDVVSLQITLSGNSITVDDLTNSKQASTSNAFNNTATKYGFGENNGDNGVKVDDLVIQ